MFVTYSYYVINSIIFSVLDVLLEKFFGQLKVELSGTTKTDQERVVEPGVVVEVFLSQPFLELRVNFFLMA